MRSACRGCQHPLTEVLLDLGHLALTGVFPRSVSEDVPTAPLTMLQCHECGLVQLGHTVDPSVLYGPTYGYRSSLNRMMVNHLRDVAYSAQNAACLSSGDAVLDIGSNDGMFLSCYEETHCALTGIDPLASRWKDSYPTQARIINDFFPSQHLRGHYKLITAFAMLYDLDDPVHALEAIACLLTPDGLFVCEVADFEVAFLGGIYDGICHEHLTYFTEQTITRLLQRAGLFVESIRKTATNGGSLLVYARKYGIASHETVEKKELIIDQAFSTRVLLQRYLLRAFVHEHRPVLGMGASTKGNTILQYCEFTREDIPYIADVNSAKVGSYTPGTKIPIISEEEAETFGFESGIIFPWSLAMPIQERWAGLKLIVPFPFIHFVHKLPLPHEMVSV